MSTDVQFVTIVHRLTTLCPSHASVVKIVQLQNLRLLPAFVTGVAAFLLAASGINHGLVDSSLPNGPGLTTDESIDIRQGNYLFESFLQYGPLMLLPGKAQEIYSRSGYIADRPPLGRFLLGAAHGLTSWAISGAELSIVNVPAARLAAAGALAVTVFLMMFWTAGRYGTVTAILCGVLYLLMPRVIGHSRIAALETLTTLAWFAAVLPLLAWWTTDRPPTNRQSLICGLMWGILMLVKIQGVFLLPMITLYSLAMFRWRAILPLSVILITGLVVFYCGWPWLWLDSVENTTSYLMSTTDRDTVHNWYLGRRYEDKATPWHYPFVMMAVTLPLHTICSFGIRLVHRRLDAVERLLLLSVALPLIVFAIPGTPVYDGTRLFLFVMPAVAILGARGLTLWGRSVQFSLPELKQGSRDFHFPRPLALMISLLLIADVALTISELGPFAGDAYNSGVRLLDPGGETFESCYWGDALNGEFWEQVPEGSTVAVAPVLHPVLLQDMMTMIPIIRQRQIQLEPFEYEPDEQRGLVLLLHRLADLPPGLRTPPPDNQPLTETVLNGRVLARLVDTTRSTWLRKPHW